MPHKQIVNHGPTPLGAYSPAIHADGLIHLSGRFAQDKAGALVGKGDVAAQTRHIIESTGDCCLPLARRSTTSSPSPSI